MLNNSMTVVANDIARSSRTVAGKLVSTSRHGGRRALRVCDRAWQNGAIALANRMPISLKLRDELISLESQLTLIADLLLGDTADRTGRVLDKVADSADSTVRKFERVFDPRVMQALARLGMPTAEIVSTLAARVASIWQELERLVADRCDTSVNAAELTDKVAVQAKGKPSRKTSRARCRVVQSNRPAALRFPPTPGRRLT